MKKLFTLISILAFYFDVFASTDFYIVGTMNQWKETDEYKMTETIEDKEWSFEFGDLDIADLRFLFKIGKFENIYFGSGSVKPTMVEGENILQANGLSLKLSPKYLHATNIKITLYKENLYKSVLTVTGTFEENDMYNPEQSEPVSGTKPSGTLPVLYLTTEMPREVIDSGEEHDSIASGTCYIECNGIENMMPEGDEEHPDSITVQGRGNYTWYGFDKKPYKLKFKNPTSLIGLRASKNYALMACADDQYAYLRNTVGLEISRRMNMPWTPTQQPIEVVWNNEYIGLYMLSETIKEALDATGGWLVEINNFEDTPQIVLNDEGNPWPLRITGSLPSVWSEEQERYLTDQWQSIMDALSAGDYATAAQYLDIDAAARFYIVQEITENRESYNGSCYLHKDIDATNAQPKWVFGPVWDFGCSFCSIDDGVQRFIWEDYAFNAHIINLLHEDAEFMASVKSQWKNFVCNNYEGLDSYIQGFIDQIAEAAKSDGARWPTYDRSDVEAAQTDYLNKLHDRIEWLTEQWGEDTPVVIECVNGREKAAKRNTYYTLQGIRVSEPRNGVLYISVAQE